MDWKLHDLVNESFFYVLCVSLPPKKGLKCLKFRYEITNFRRRLSINVCIFGYRTFTIILSFSKSILYMALDSLAEISFPLLVIATLILVIIILVLITN